MGDFMQIIVGMLLGAAMYSLFVKLQNYLLLKDVEKRVTSRLEELKSKMINSRIDEVNGALYLYSEDNGEFLCQANSFPELEKIASEKFPGKLFNIPPHQMRKYENETN